MSFRPAGVGRQQLRLRTTRAVPVALRARRSQHRLAGSMGDRGVQAAQAVAQRRPVQAHIGHVHRVQEHRVENSQRPETLTTHRKPIVGGRVGFWIQTKLITRT